MGLFTKEEHKHFDRETGEWETTHEKKGLADRLSRKTEIDRKIKQFEKEEKEKIRQERLKNQLQRLQKQQKQTNKTQKMRKQIRDIQQKKWEQRRRTIDNTMDMIFGSPKKNKKSNYDVFNSPFSTGKQPKFDILGKPYVKKPKKKKKQRSKKKNDDFLNPSGIDWGL